MYINAYMLYIKRFKYRKLLPVPLINQNSQRNSKGLKQGLNPQLTSPHYFHQQHVSWAITFLYSPKVT